MPAGETHTLTILSIDGGGIRGVVPLYLLAKMEEEMRRRLNRPDFMLSSCFDTLSGTSTGAIITAGLSVPDAKTGRPLYDASFILKAYLSAGQRIFRASTWESMKSLGGLASSKYSPQALEKYFEFFFKEHTMGDLLYNNLIIAYDLIERKPFLFMGQAFGDSPFLVKEALRASTSAPVYFQPANIKDLSGKSYSLIDGGVIANSSTLVLLQYLLEHELITRNTRLNWLSLGTGIGAPAFQIKDLDGALSWLFPLLDILNAGSSSNTSMQTQTIVEKLFSGSSFIRINPALGDASPDLDDISPENLQALQDAAQNYINTHGEVWEAIIVHLLDSYQLKHVPH